MRGASRGSGRATQATLSGIRDRPEVAAQVIAGSTRAPSCARGWVEGANSPFLPRSRAHTSAVAHARGKMMYGVRRRASLDSITCRKASKDQALAHRLNGRGFVG